MPVHKPVTEPGIYFITFTCHQWQPLIELTNGYDLVYNWFTIMQNKDHTVTGYVVMPNHIHLLLHFTGGHSSLNTVVGNGKRFMAYHIVKRLEQNNQQSILHKLQESVENKDKTRGKKHEVWEDSFDVKECRTEAFILQKLTYIHNNPCSGKWKLADSTIDYTHSSALFYINGKHASYVVKDYREFLYSSLWDE
jgi:REP element-mobilizing transposase RayT